MTSLRVAVFPLSAKKQIGADFATLPSSSARVNPRPAGVFSRTRPAGGGGGADSAPLPNSRTNRRSEAGEAAIESPEREDSSAH